MRSNVLFEIRNYFTYTSECSKSLFQVITAHFQQDTIF